ncbi:two-component response regulator ARR18-like isoform X2 [Pyrus x bretschneideri]|uniref:two-component response regulator ARR18-like isoform X2 n=1 Tax=Pyrus x bretschneideri TaxID=225117 RepID=UPI000510BE66|nr:two-component response regulator ARR18-like isoform X2 [Pyrus x bretschneideri]
MMGSQRGSECSKTSPSDKQNEDGSESGENYSNGENSKPKNNGGSSSNSTVEESDQKKTSVRPYVRSKMPRLRWTPDLHLRFIHAVERLGGQDRATPKLVLQLMNIKGLNIAHVKSHLQMYRSKKIDDTGQVLADHQGHLVECGDKNIYNLSQLPMLQGYNRSHSTSFRYGSYGDTNSWTALENPRFSRSSTGFQGNWSTSSTGNNAYNYLTSCSFGDHHPQSSWITRTLQEECQLHNIREFLKPKEFITSFNTNRGPYRDSDTISKNLVQDQSKMLKRKASDCDDLDLDLSLRLTSKKNDEDHTHEVDSNLSLCLYSPPTSSKLRRLKE